MTDGVAPLLIRELFAVKLAMSVEEMIIYQCCVQDLLMQPPSGQKIREVQH